VFVVRFILPLSIPVPLKGKKMEEALFRFVGSTSGNQEHTPTPHTSLHFIEGLNGRFIVDHVYVNEITIVNKMD
jgi:hypothetical protein